MEHASLDWVPCCFYKYSVLTTLTFSGQYKTAATHTINVVSLPTPAAGNTVLSWALATSATPLPVLISLDLWATIATELLLVR